LGSVVVAAASFVLCVLELLLLLLPHAPRAAAIAATAIQVVIVLIVSPSLRLRDQEAILDLRVRRANGTAVNVLPPVVVYASN
jgi:membrane protein implicated in regulation of membrane protease activity